MVMRWGGRLEFSSNFFFFKTIKRIKKWVLTIEQCHEKWMFNCLTIHNSGENPDTPIIPAISGLIYHEKEWFHHDNGALIWFK